MRKMFTMILMASAPLALAACNKPAAEPDETVVTEETVTEEPAADAMAPAADATAPAADAMATDAKAPATDERGSDERGSDERGSDERGVEEK